MTTTIYSEFCKGGRLLLPYIFVREIGIKPTIILSELISEFNYASKYGVDDYLGFIFDIKRANKILNIEPEEIISQLEYLQKIHFIETEDIGIEESYYIRINEDNILSFKREKETKNFCNNWDDGLLSSLNPTHVKVDFSESTLKIKQYFDSNAKNSKSIPMIVYLHLDKHIKDFENSIGNIFVTLCNINEFLEECASENDGKIGIIEFYNALNNTCVQIIKQQQKSFKDEIPPDFL